MNSYELMLIFDPNFGEDKIGEIVSKIEQKAKGFGAELEKTDKWGSKRLASNFKNAPKLAQGYYVMLYFKSNPDVPAKLQAYLKVTENIVRHSIYKSQPKTLAGIEGAPVEGKEEIDAVDIGEIKGAEQIG